MTQFTPTQISTVVNAGDSSSSDTDSPVLTLSQEHVRGAGDTELWPLRKYFSQAHLAWRTRMVEKIAGTPLHFPAVVGAKRDDLRDLVNEETSRIRVIARILEVLYRNPDLGNHRDPLDELIYIMLSRRTDEGAYQGVFRALKTAYPRWEMLIDAPLEDVEHLVAPSGLGPFKAADLRAALRIIRQTFGEVSLVSLHKWDDAQAEDFLTSLPGVGRKTALCVLLYALDRDVFPVDTHVGRVLTRMGLFRAAGFNLAGAGDHKKRQAVLADLIPPELRYSMHVNLVMHGRAVCVSRIPRCDECALQNLCMTFRKVRVLEVHNSARPAVVDLFCGAGGLSEGFRQAGFRTVMAVDTSPVATRTFRLNHPEVPDEQVLCENLHDARANATLIHNLRGFRQVDVLICSPRSQGSSHAEWRSRVAGQHLNATEEDRNHLFRQLVGLLETIAPRIVLMENVPGISEVQFEDGETSLGVSCRAMQQQGYQTAVWLLNAAAYGVPQARLHRIIVGSRDGLPPTPPAPTHHAILNPYDEHSLPGPSSLRTATTPFEAIGDLPPVAANKGCWIDLYSTSLHASDWLEQEVGNMLHPQSVLLSHVLRYQNETDLERHPAKMLPGGDHFALLRRRPDPKNYTATRSSGRYYRLAPDRTSRTSLAHLRKYGNSYFYPFRTRFLTVREAARLQTFPDRYIFTGSWGDQLVQIGTAVPPLLARVIAVSLLEHLRSVPPKIANISDHSPVPASHD